MNLFNRKTLKRHVKPTSIPRDHLAALGTWADMMASDRWLSSISIQSRRPNKLRTFKTAAAFPFVECSLIKAGELATGRIGIVGKNFYAIYLPIVCAALFPALGHALECNIFPETQESSTSVYPAAPRVWIDYATDDLGEAGHEIMKIKTPEQKKEILGHLFIDSSEEYFNCETRINKYDGNIVSSTCSGEKIYERKDSGDYTMRMGTASATFFKNGAGGQEDYKWRIAENKVILRLDPSDSTKILHVQYTETSAGYYSCD